MPAWPSRPLSRLRSPSATRRCSCTAASGYLHGTEVERHYRDARILPIGGGATEVLTDLAARLLGYWWPGMRVSSRGEPRGDAGQDRRPRGRGGEGRGRWRREVRRPPPRPREAAAPRADRAARRRGFRVPGAVAPGRLGLRLPRRRVAGDGHRGGRGCRVPDHRQRPHCQGRRKQPVDGEEGLPGRPDRGGEQPPHRSRSSSRAARTCRRRRRSSSPAASCSAT